MSARWHLDTCLCVARGDIHLVHVLETLEIDGAGLNIEVDLRADGGSFFALFDLFKGTVDAVLEGEIGVVPDYSLV